jgi:hypothetical protein
VLSSGSFRVDGSMARECPSCGDDLKLPRSEKLSVHSIPTIGFDIAKSVLQVHGVDAVAQTRAAAFS